MLVDGQAVGGAGSAGPQGPAGPQGLPGLPGTTLYAALTGVPSTFPPSPHHTAHEPGGIDALAADAVAATPSLRSLGSGAAQACGGADARLTNARTPTAHAATHKPGAPDALLSQLQAAGTSSSGTAGTVLAQLTAAAGSQLLAWTLHAAQASATATQLKVTVTYSDATTITLTTTAATAAAVLGSPGGLELLVGGAHASQVAGLAKVVTGLKVETAGTGTGVRAAVLAAVQVGL